MQNWKIGMGNDNQSGFNYEYGPVLKRIGVEERSDTNYEPQRYWRGPIWPHVNWMISEGLKEYGYNELSKKIRMQTLELISKLGFHEYYHPLGEFGFGGDSFSWTAAVYLILCKTG